MVCVAQEGQVTRLRDKLAREREIREKADMLNEDDMERLIQFLNESGAFRPQVPGNGVGAPAVPQNNGRTGRRGATPQGSSASSTCPTSSPGKARRRRRVSSGKGNGTRFSAKD